MKPNLNCPTTTATSGLALQSRRAFQPLSLQNRVRQGASRPVLASSAPVPALARERGSFRAPATFRPPVASQSSTPCKAPGLPPRRSERPTLIVLGTDENWLYALLTVLCALALAFKLWTQFRSVSGSQDFIQFVRQLLA